MHDMATTPDYAHTVAKFEYDPLDAGGVIEARRISLTVVKDESETDS